MQLVFISPDTAKVCLQFHFHQVVAFVVSELCFECCLLEYHFSLRSWRKQVQLHIH